jgi:hypothetical protein
MPAHAAVMVRLVAGEQLVWLILGAVAQMSLSAILGPFAPRWVGRGGC